LLLHGLDEAQVEDILAKRTLLRNLTVSVPEPREPDAEQKAVRQPSYEIRLLKVALGQSVTAGETLAVLCDHAELFIEGNAFDKDVAAVNRAVEKDWPVRAVIESDEVEAQVISRLKILYVSGTVDPESRTFHFYVRLPNNLLRDAVGDDGHRFISWQYKPGQRVQLTVPVEQWRDRIVLPVEAVAQDGVETYVFSPNGDHFDRRPVHVEYRDRFSVVIANDGSVFPGDAVALTGAQQMQLALKNKSGGGIDPHAGHNH
jgi:multidrug efflux pump subunit AcrA (membrane-fusion protein)